MLSTIQVLIPGGKMPELMQLVTVTWEVHQCPTTQQKVHAWLLVGIVCFAYARPESTHDKTNMPLVLWLCTYWHASHVTHAIHAVS